MKKSVVGLFFILVLFLAMLVSANGLTDFWNKMTGKVTMGICTDSDSGDNYYVKGTVNSALNVTTSDKCINSTLLNEHSCPADVSQGTKITAYTCPFGCSNGACTSSDEIKCETFQVGQERIHLNANGVTGAQFCADSGKFCSKVYVEHKIVTENSAQDGYGTCDITHGPENINSLQVTCCNSPVPCSDTDSGKNYYAKGQTTQNGVLYGVDQCETHSGNSRNIVKSCTGSDCFLTETFCSSYVDSTPSGETYSCPNGCSNGACLSENSNATALCTDSDGGAEYYIKGYRINKNSAYASYNVNQYDYCIKNPTITGGSVIADESKKVNSCPGGDCYVIEYVCKSDLSDAHRGYQCPYGCGNGACYPKTDSGSNTGSKSEICTISGGEGTCKFSDKIYSIKIGWCGVNNEDSFYITSENLNSSSLRGMLFLEAQTSVFFERPEFFENRGAVAFIEVKDDVIESKSLLLPDGNIVEIISPICSQDNPSSAGYTVNLSFMEFRDPQIITQSGIYDVYYGDLIKMANVEAVVQGIIWHDDYPYLQILSPNGNLEGNMNLLTLYELNLAGDSTPYSFSNDGIITYGLEPNYIASSVKVKLLELIPDSSVSMSHAKIEISRIGEGENGTVIPSNETGPIEIPLDGTILCNGCASENKCYPFGYRKSGEYCSESGQFVNQMGTGSCNNDFECSSNLCVNDECVGRSFLQRIFDWFRKLFGAE